MTLSIIPVATPAELDEFLRLPNVLYRDFAGYEAPLMMERRAVLDPAKGSFFAHGRARYWLARRDGRTVGRVSAQIDDAQPAGAFEDAGLFGCLDAIDDDAVTGALLQTAEAWLRAEGRARAAGPFALNMNSEPGLLVEGNDGPPLSMVAWHPNYLERHVLAAGYAPCRDVHYWRLSDLEEKAKSLPDIGRPMSRMPDLKIRSLDMKHLADDVEIIRQLYNDAWKDNWGFVPLQPADVAAISKDMRPFVKGDYGIIVELGGRPVAAALAFPNLFEVTNGIGPDPSLLGWAKLGYRTLFHRFRTGFIILLGVQSEMRHSVGGAVVAMAMIGEVIDRLSRYEHKSGWLEAGWVLDNNVALQKILMQYGFEKKRTLRIFDKALAE